MNDNRDSLAARQAAGLRQLADMIEQNTELAPLAGYLDGFHVFHVTTKDDAQTVIRAALAAGAKVDKKYGNDYFAANLTWGPVTAQLLSSRAAVCEKVVTTREVIEMVPDAKALAAVPKVAVTHTVEDVQWVCSPLLAADSQTAVA